MKTSVRNYRIIVEKEKKGAGQEAYIAYAPSLGISDFGKTIEEAVFHIEQAIKLYVETLVDLKQLVPEEDTDDYFVTTRKIQIRKPVLPIQ